MSFEDCFHNCSLSFNYKIDVKDLDKKYGTKSTDEILNEYRNDDDYEMGDLMEGSKNNVEPQVGVDVVQEYLDSKENVVDNPIPEALKNAMMNAKEI